MKEVNNTIMNAACSSGCARCTVEPQEEVEPQENEVNVKKYLLSLIPSALLFTAGILVGTPSWLKSAFLIMSYAIAGWDIILGALRNILRGKVFDENFLMCLATFGAFAIGELPEAAAVMLFFKTGELFQDIAVNNSRKSIRSLMDLRPDYANLKTNEGITRVDPGSVNPGDLIMVKPGERVPLDGEVVDGSSSLDTSALTGESVPRYVSPGDAVLSGSVNSTGVITIKVTKTLSQSTVSKILDLVQNSSAKKAPVESFITRFARYYTPAVVAAAILTAVIPPLLTGWSSFDLWFHRSLIFLVVSCPCALVISVPLSFFGGLGGASRKGILIKGSSFLEALNNAGTVVFDKTGTLTKGSLRVSNITAVNGYSGESILETAALAESHSSHPIARSIIDAYGTKVNSELIESYEEISGQGVRAVIDGKTVTAGSKRLLTQDGYTIDTQCEAGGTAIHIGVDNTYAGYISVADEIREDSSGAVQELRNSGIKEVIMLSGDNKHTAEAVGSILGVDEVYAELLPHQKVEQLEVIQNRVKLSASKRNKVVFVGDGINDAPVLARADIGIAMGGLGSDAAIDASDIVLMTDEPFKVVEALKIARKTRQIVWQNIFFAFGVKLLVMALGIGGAATMWEAVFADVGVALIAVFNALRLIRK